MNPKQTFSVILRAFGWLANVAIALFWRGSGAIP